jgi:hypothetical protein
MTDILKENPVVAVAPLLETIFSQFKSVKKRREWVKKKTLAFGPLGGTHWTVGVLSIWISVAVATVAVLSSLAFLATNGMGWEAPDGPLRSVLTWNDAHYSIVLFVWLVHTVLVYPNGLARLLWGAVWLIPSLRSRIGFTNATWHIDQGDVAPAIALAREAHRRVAGEIVTSMVTTGANANLALRPGGLSEEQAANVLFFGHVIEGAMSENGVHWSGEIWTAFYEALGSVAKLPTHPLDPSAVAAFAGTSFYQQVIALLNYHRPASLSPIPNDYDIPARVDESHKYLATTLGGNARILGKGFFGYSYQTLLKRSRNVPGFDREEIRRQFAKLAILWNIWPKARRPAVFKIPFSASIAIYLLDSSWLRTDANRLATDDPYFLNAFDVAESRLVDIGADIVANASDPPTQSWRETQKKNATTQGLDWNWYLRYRIDQHIYHLARTRRSENWRKGDRAIERVVPIAA